MIIFQSNLRLKCEIINATTVSTIKKSKIIDSERSSILSTLSRSIQHAKVIAPKNGIKAPTEYVNGPDLFSFGDLILNIAIAEGPKVTKDAQSNVIPIVASV